VLLTSSNSNKQLSNKQDNKSYRIITTFEDNVKKD